MTTASDPTTRDDGTETVSITSMTPPTAYPCEDWEAGLYLDARTTVTTVSTARRDPGLPLTAPLCVEQGYYVAAEDFMGVQKERDDFRKALALINAWRIAPVRSEERLCHLLAGVGQGDGEAEAMLSVIRWAEDQRREPGSGE